jgi:ATP-binding cassette subfamily F protein 3
MKRVATCIVEVRDGHVTNYRGDYEAYLYSVNKEIEEGEREQAKGLSKAPPAVATKAAKAAPRPARRSERDIRKEMSNLERNIARLDEQKKQLNEQFLTATDPAESLRLHTEMSGLTSQLAESEERWCRLQEELEESS